MRAQFSEALQDGGASLQSALNASRWRTAPLLAYCAITAGLFIVRPFPAFHIHFMYFLMAASTTWPTSTEVVTLPTPPGTGVMASTMDST